MCGITGFITKNDSSIYKKDELLDNMLAQLEHRGPDDCGKRFYSSENYLFALGHRRLSIIDISSNGHQPMGYQNWSIVFNGEIYNYKEIRDELKNKGYHFQTETDTEVVIKSYIEYGMGCFKRFNGMWAIALYNDKTKQLILSRDRSGVKPLYYYFHNGFIAFASEIKAITTHPEFERLISQTGQSYFFQYGYIKEPYSIFENCYKLEAGNILVITANEIIKIEKIKYWDILDFYLMPKLRIHSDEMLEEVERLMIKGFNYRMVADVPIGVFLSGGIDSSLVTSILQRSNDKKISTFSIGFKNEKFNEAPFAKKIADYLGTEHHEYYCEDSDVEEMMSLLPEVLDEPFSDSSILPSMLVSRYAKKKVTVALSADGGDELFAGYPVYDQVLGLTSKMERYQPMAKILKVILSNGLFEKLGIVGKYGSKINKLLEISSHPNSIIKNFEVFNKQIFDFELKHKFGIKGENLLYGVNYKDFNDPLDALLYYSYKTYMNNDVLYKMDKATMAFGLEGREPFLDTNLVEFVAQLPSDIKIKEGALKWTAKQVLFRYIPKELYHGKKMGFSIPQELLSKYVYGGINNNVKLLSEMGFSLPKKPTPKTLEWRIAWNVYIYMMWYKRWAT